jgi:hypothetical protein
VRQSTFGAWASTAARWKINAAMHQFARWRRGVDGLLVEVNAAQGLKGA